MNNIEEIKKVIEQLDSKDFTLHFFVIDTKGNPTAGVANIYEHVKVLNSLGYNAGIIHEKADYHGVQEWLGEEYAKLPHIAIDSGALNVGPQDFIIIPEVFSNLMEQTANFPSKRIVFAQSYEYILEILMLGKTWRDYGINDVITTTEKQSEYINGLFPGLTRHIIPVGISDMFVPSDKPKKPIISLVTRDQQEAMKIVKAFYLKYPQYKWITFRDLRGLPKESFAQAVGDSCLGVWVDPISSFGTFPLECMEANTPVLGVTPNMIPEWMEERTIAEDGSETVSIKGNGVWVNSSLEIPDVIAEFMQAWLEDSIPQQLMDSIEASKGQYTMEKQVKVIEEVYGTIINNRKEELANVIAQTENNVVNTNN